MREDKYNGSIELVIDTQIGDRQNSYLAKQYYKLPLQVMPPFYQDDDGTVFIYLLNPSGGVLEYDNLLVDVIVKDEASTFISTPAANKIYKRKEKGIAKQKNIFHVGDQSVLEFCPDEVIPYKNSAFQQKNEFYLKGSSKLITWDILSAGRVACGESFQFVQYQSMTNIYVDDVLLVKDNMDIRPFDADVVNMLAMEQYQFLATIYVYAEECNEELVEILRSEVKVQSFMGVSLAADNVIIIKLLSVHAYEILEEVNLLWDKIRKNVLKKNAVRVRKH